MCERAFEYLHFYHKELWGKLGSMNDKELDKAMRTHFYSSASALKTLTYASIAERYKFVVTFASCPACAYASLVARHISTEIPDPCRTCCPIVRKSSMCTSPNALYAHWITAMEDGLFITAKDLAIKIRDMKWHRRI